MVARGRVTGNFDREQVSLDRPALCEIPASWANEEISPPKTKKPKSGLPLQAQASDTSCFVVNLYPMKRRLSPSIISYLFLAAFIASATPAGAQSTTKKSSTTQDSRGKQTPAKTQPKAKPSPRTTQAQARKPPEKSSTERNEALWQRALAIHRRAIVIDTHNDITTPMTNDDYDLGGAPPVPYRTSMARMKQGGQTAEFFSLYIKPWYVAHGGAARRTLDMIDSVYRAVERHPKDLMFATASTDIRRAKAQGN